MANFLADALDISKSTIVINWVAKWAISWVSLDWKTQEDIVKVLWGSVRRRKDTEYEWSADQVALYDNLKDIHSLREGQKFNIEITFRNPDRTDATNLGQRLIMRDCTMNAHNASIWESTTYKMSWTFADWSVEAYTD